MQEMKSNSLMSSRWRWLVLTVICIAYLLVFTQRTGPGVISDQLQTEFHVSAAVLGTITSIQYLLYMIVQIPVGLYGDKAGPSECLSPASCSMVLEPSCFQLRTLSACCSSAEPL